MSPTPAAQAQNNDSPVFEQVAALKANIGHRRSAHAHRFHHALQQHAHAHGHAETREFNLAEVTPSGGQLPAHLAHLAKGAVNPEALQMMASVQEPKTTQRFDVEHANGHSGPGSSPAVAGETAPALA